MYENYRENFGRRHSEDDHRQDEQSRWRRGEERYRREARSSQGDRRFEDHRSDGYGSRDFDQRRGWSDDDYGSRGGFGRDADRGQSGGYAQRDYYAGRDYGPTGEDRHVHHWHEQDREMRAGHPYVGTYGGTGNSSYFTGTQGSWAMPPAPTPSPYHTGGRHFGADYRQRGYGADDDQRGFWDRATDEVASWFGDEDAARRREMDHRGRGPKDYIRSDERIRDDANDRLTDDWRLDASNITVTVSDGEITLNGTVTSREAKRRAEDLVDNISGVKHVQNNLRVQQSAGTGMEGGTGGSAGAGGFGASGSSSTSGGLATQAASDQRQKV
jgi:osmotically-inducible protein OsmY